MADRRLVQMDGSDGQHIAAKGDPGTNPRTLDVISYRTYVQASEARKCHEAPGHAHLHTLLLSIEIPSHTCPGPRCRYDVASVLDEGIC